jgi:regulatory protein
MIRSVDDLEEQARQILLRVLERGPKSSAELREILLAAEIPAAIADQVIGRFAEVELINDQQLAQDVASAGRKYRGLSKTMVRRKLSDKGLGAEVIDSVTEGISDEDELQVATELAQKRFGQLSSYPAEVRNRRLVGFLQRRGFSSNVVFAAIREVETLAVKSEL